MPFSRFGDPFVFSTPFQRIRRLSFIQNASKAFLLLLMLCYCSSTHAQVDPNFVGLIPYGAYHSGNIDNINLYNGHLTVTIPMVSYPQRGGKLKLEYALIYQSGGGYGDSVCDPSGTNCQYAYQGGAGSWALVDTNGKSLSSSCGPSVTNNGYYDCFAYVYDSVTVHPLADTNSGLRSTDASGYTANSTTWNLAYHSQRNEIIIDPQGIRTANSWSSGPGIHLPEPIMVEDPSGNKITFANGVLTDSVGRTISQPIESASPTDFGGCSGTQPTVKVWLWSLPGLGGATNLYKFCYTNVTSTNAGPGTGSQTYPIIQSVVLPNVTTWTFTYTTDGLGDLSQITFPTGGTLSYTWTSKPPCVYTHSWLFTRSVATRTLDPKASASPAGTWKYNYTGATTITDPMGNDSTHSFADVGATCNAYEHTTQFYQGSSASGTLLKSVVTDYSTINPPSWPGNGPNIQFVALNTVPVRVTAQYPNGQQTKTERDYDSGFTMNAPRYTPSGQLAGATFTGLFGKAIQKRDYDYSASAPPLLSQTKIAYMAFSGPNSPSYLSNNLLSLPYTVQTLDASSTQKAFTQYNYDETSLASSGLNSSNQWDSAPATGTHRGNNTSTLHWLNSGSLTCQSGSSGGSGSNVVSYVTYFDDGNVQTSKDPCNNATTSAYSLTYWAAFPTTVTNALNQSSNNVFDLSTGLLTSTTDPNYLTNSFNFDNMWRPSQVNHADGAIDTVTHQESTLPFTATLKKQINPYQTKITTNIFDGLGRVTQNQLPSDPQGTVYTDTTYDLLGRIATVSNPYRAGTDITTSTGITTYGYDALSRKITETYPEGSVLTTAYCGPSTLVTDPTNKWRRSRVDGLGRLVEVDEPNSSTASVASTGCPGTGEPIWVTTYGYDALGNLTSVLQNGSHQRSFTYDSLSRLLTATNPETGTITYTYNPDGPVHTKQDARGITTTYLYDALHRETSASYSNGDSTITTGYDGSNCLGLTNPPCSNIGHRTSMTDAAGSESWAFQVDKTHSQTIHVDQRTTASLVNGIPTNISKTATYYLDFTGNVTQAVYPTGRVANYTYDAANRPSTAVDGSNGITYATGFKTSPGGTCLNNLTCYTPQGTFYGLSIGQTSSFTGLNLTHTYNIKLQPQRFNASTGTTVNAAATATWTSQFLYKWTATIKIATPSPTNVSAGESITASGWTPSFINGSYVVSNVIDSTHFTVTLRDNTNHGYGTNASGSLTFVPNAMDISYSFSFPANSGHVYYIFNNLDSTRTQSFTYDQLNRIASAFTSIYSFSPTHCWKEAYNVDAWGNLQSIAATTDPNYTGCTQESGFSTTADGNNHLPIFAYDASGNASGDGVNTYNWDGESQLKSATSAGTTTNYTYDGDGRRVSKIGSKLYWYGSGGKILAETDASGNTTAEYIFFGGKRIAMIPWSGSPAVAGNPIYYVEDLLGTSRVTTTNTGVVCYDADFYPYGGERSYTNTCPQNYKFEGQERDTETGNDDFGARYYSNRFGRWLSADWSNVPVPVPYANLSNPQTLNLYAMVGDDPETFADLDGHCGAPSGLQPGQVGICIASFIKSITIGLIGRGDGRGPEGNGGTSRIETRLTVDPGKGTVTKTDETVGRSGIICKECGLQGTGKSEITDTFKDKDNGSTYFTISQDAHSSMALGGLVLGNIRNHLDLEVTKDQKVGVGMGSTAKDYPSLEIYSYTMDKEGSITTQRILFKQESGDPGDLKKLQKPIEPVNPQ